MTWYKKIFTEYKKEVIISAITSLAITFAFSFWYFSFGGSFEWKEINPISVPTLSIRLLSALVFVSLGRVLYRMKFYYVLYMILVVVLRAKDVYYRFKKVIWHSLMAVMGFIVVPWIIDVLNGIVSFFYNIGIFVLYLSPMLSILFMVFVISLLLFIKKFMGYSKEDWNIERGKSSFCNNISIRIVNNQNVAGHTVFNNWLGVLAKCSLPCPRCKAVGFYDAHTSPSNPMYRMCKFCGLWQEAGGCRKRCKMFYHDCPNVKGAPSPIKEIAGYDWNLGNSQGCDRCKQAITKKVRWPVDDKKHPFNQLRRELNQIHGIP